MGWDGMGLDGWMDGWIDSQMDGIVTLVGRSRYVGGYTDRQTDRWIG